MSTLPKNPILSTDSYKLSHGPAYPKNVVGMFSYIEARSKKDWIVPFGLQMWIKKSLLTPVTIENIDEAEAFAKAHGEPFNRAMWEKVVNVYDGFIPIRIRSVKEGTRVPSSNVLVTVECEDPDLFFLASYIETSLLRGVWYPSTIASNDYRNYTALKKYAAMTCDDLSGLPFMLHDFGGRGVTSSEQAEIGGAAHLVYFMGSDTIEGVRAANFYYNEAMAGFSVPASEHSIQCSYGSASFQQKEYLEHMLAEYAKPGAIVSIVLDGYDVYREAQQLCSMKDEIVKSGARVVLRPDSGNPLEVIPRLLQMMEMAFGSVTNTKGYKVINNVGLLQGDGVEYSTMVEILEAVTDLGYSSANIVFGSGGGLLQKVNRDTYKWAQKASAVKLKDGTWKDIWKDPVTDPGKKSKTGRLTLLRSKMTGEYLTAPILDKMDEEWEDVMQVVYENGKLYNETSLLEVRARAKA